MNQRGSVFLLTLAVLAGLVALVGTLAIANREYTRSQSDRMAIRRADMMVEAGIQKALANLRNQNTSQVMKSDPWAHKDTTGKVQIYVGKDSFRVQVIDASSLINVNTADEATLKKLSLTSEQIASLLDWREQGAAPRAEGAKDEYYTRLVNPYSAKQKSLDSVDELLLIKGFTPDTLYSPDAPLGDILTTDSKSSDQSVAGEDKIDLNSASMNDLMAIGVPQDLAVGIIQARGKGFGSLGDAIRVQNMTKAAARAIADNTAIGKDKERSGLININTAPANVLETIPGISPDIAESIVERQDSGYFTLGSLLDVPGMELAVFAGAVDKLCVGSRTFIARVVGTAAGIRSAAEAVISLTDDGKPQVIRVQKQYYPLVHERWAWPETPTSQIYQGVTQ